MRALVIGHDHIGGTGYIGDALIAAGWTLENFTVVPESRFYAPDVEGGTSSSPSALRGRGRRSRHGLATRCAS